MISLPTSARRGGLGSGNAGTRSCAGGRGWICELPLAPVILFPRSASNPGVFHPKSAERRRELPFGHPRGELGIARRGEASHSASSRQEFGEAPALPRGAGLDSGGGRSFAAPSVPPHEAREGQTGSAAMNPGCSRGCRGEGIKHFEKLAKIPPGALRRLLQTRPFSPSPQKLQHAVAAAASAAPAPHPPAPRALSPSLHPSGTPLNPCLSPLPRPGLSPPGRPGRARGRGCELCQPAQMPDSLTRQLRFPSPNSALEK